MLKITTSEYVANDIENYLFPEQTILKNSVISSWLLRLPKYKALMLLYELLIQIEFANIVSMRMRSPNTQ